MAAGTEGGKMGEAIEARGREGRDSERRLRKDSPRDFQDHRMKI